MTALLILSAGTVEANRDLWLRARMSGIGGSEIAQVLGIAPPGQGSPTKLYYNKLEGIETGDRDAMMRGRYLEPYVADRLWDEHPEILQRPGGLYRHADRSWMIATFDRLVMDRDEVSAVAVDLWHSTKTPTSEFGLSFPAQIKTAGSYDGWGEEGQESVIPVHYRAQALWEMEVWQADRIVLPVLFIIPWKLRLYWLYRDAAAQHDIDIMLDEAQAFMGRLERRDPPDVDWTPATTETLRLLHPSLVDDEVVIPRELARRYFAARAAKSAAERRLSLATNQMRERMGPAARAVAKDPSGKLVKVATRRVGDANVKAHVRHTDALWAGPWGDSEGDQ